MVSVVTSPEVDELNEPPAEIFDEVEDLLYKNGKTQNHLLLLNEENFNPNYDTNYAYKHNKSDKN